MEKYLRDPRTPFVAICAASLGLVGGGILLAQFLNLAACPLCIVQRMLYLSLGFMAVIGLAIGHPIGRRATALMLAVTGATGAFVAGYQVWIQRFAHDTKCAADLPWWERMVDWAGERVPLLFQSSGLCSDPAWRFLGLSIAEWSLAAFTCLTALALFAAFRRASR